MAAERPSPLLTVYSRSYCHLCDDLISGLRKLQARSHFEIAIVDVDCDAALEERYGYDVPVLVHGDRELCRHRLNESLVTDYLVEIG
ncbi:MAG TPA: glutaredoxin family protein [Burkholderiales bacterium]|jgi:thioredoxin reductase (NADPH)|nr:glutaredoxin family protein [Burkholderiales bacterium]